MRAAKSPENIIRRLNKGVDELSFSSGALYSKAIENADGVPFQLIFGPKIGDGYYLTAGSGIKQLLGISSEEFTEKLFHDMIEEIIPLSNEIPLDLPESRKKFVSGDIKSYKAEVLIRLPGGESKWILDSSLPLVDADTDKVIGAFGILFDIDEQKKILYNLEKAKERAEQGDRLKSAFLRNISHEIRTPLNAIVGFSALLTEPENNQSRLQEYTDIILRSSDHLLEILNDIVEISNIEADTIEIRKEIINIYSNFRRVYERFVTKATEKKIAFSFEPPLTESAVNIYTDGYKLTQILTYLVDNAVKFTREGEIKFGYSLIGNSIEFYVSDSGIGIKKEHQSMIFNRFFQVESSTIRSYGGTGLGLSIARAYVEMLGGKIWFTSQPGEGSVFYFTLPLNFAKL